MGHFQVVGDNGRPIAVFEFDLFIKRQHHGVYFGAKDGVHQSFFEVGALNAGDSPVVFDAEEDQAAAQIGEGDDLFGELFRANVVSFEHDAGVFAVLDDFKEIGAAHQGLYFKPHQEEASRIYNIP